MSNIHCFFYCRLQVRQSENRKLYNILQHAQTTTDLSAKRKKAEENPKVSLIIIFSFIHSIFFAIKLFRFLNCYQQSDCK